MTFFDEIRPSYSHSTSYYPSLYIRFSYDIEHLRRTTPSRYTMTTTHILNSKVKTLGHFLRKAPWYGAVEGAPALTQT